MVEAKVDERATTTVGILDEAVSPTALEREVEPRIARLEELVAALGVVLERFQSARPAFGATVFDNFDDAGASADALGILSEATADARLDLHVLQRDVPSLVAPSEAGLQRPFASRFGLLRESSNGLAGRFEEHRRTIGLTAPSLSPSGVARLNEFVAVAVRVLLDITEVMDVLRRDVRRPGLAAPAVTAPRAPTRGSRERRRTAVATIGMPVAAALWQAVRRRRTRVMFEFAGLAVIGVVILVSAQGGGPPPGALTGAGSSSAGPGQTGIGGVAMGGGSPSVQPSPGASAEPRASDAPPPPDDPTPVPPPPAPPSTPRPTDRPALTLGPSAAASRFDGRITTAAGSMNELLNDITTDGQNADFAVARSAADDIKVIAQSERAWLRSHPPADCFESSHATALATYEELIDDGEGDHGCRRRQRRHRDPQADREGSWGHCDAEAGREQGRHVLRLTRRRVRVSRRSGMLRSVPAST